MKVTEIIIPFINDEKCKTKIKEISGKLPKNNFALSLCSIMQYLFKYNLLSCKLIHKKQ